jgi:hypothetical protein
MIKNSVLFFSLMWGVEKIVYLDSMTTFENELKHKFPLYVVSPLNNTRHGNVLKLTDRKKFRGEDVVARHRTPARRHGR